MSETQLDLTKIKGVESESIDLDKFHKQNAIVDSAEVIKVSSNYTPLIEGTQEHQLQYVLKVSSEILESIGEGDNQIDFRASELFNLEQDKQGNLTGFPKGEKSNLAKFCKDLRIDMTKIDNLQELIDAIRGKNATIKSYDKEVKVDGKDITRTYLKFLY